MLHFLRKYQRFFFLIITFVVCITFVFFGTYSTTPRDVSGDEEVIRTVAGKSVTRADLFNMTLFLSTDLQNQKEWQVVWGPNFLNDGVITNDFLQTGLAKGLVASYYSDLKDDLEKQREKEKKFSPYVHPTVPFQSAEAVWGTFAPQLKETLNSYQSDEGAFSLELFEKKMKLFLLEKKFSPQYLRQVLRMREEQYGWIPADPRLFRESLSLFDYQTAEDWFGRSFVELVGQFIFNAADLAEERGYVVTKEEAVADLMYRCATSFNKLREHPRMGVTSAKDYFREQVRRLNMEQAQVVSLWQKVMLFRRLFDDVGNSVLMDSFAYKKFHNYANATVDVDLYQLPQEMRFFNYRDLQKFETYLTAVTSTSRKGKVALELPSLFLPVKKVKEKYPQLVATRYLLRMTHIDIDTLQVKVGLKATWEWQLNEKNWEILEKEFPELALKDALTRDERFAALNSLDFSTREGVDLFSRAKIVEQNPQWIDEALTQTESKPEVVYMRETGHIGSLSDLKDRKTLKKLLDLASIANRDEDIASAMDAAKELLHYSQDGKHFYRIVVLDRDAGEAILTFSEANDGETLENLLDSKLEKEYTRMKRAYPKRFLDENRKEKPLEEVKDIVADNLFSDVVEAIFVDDKENSPEGEKLEKMSGASCAHRRFAFYVRLLRELVEKNLENREEFLQKKTPETIEGVLPERQLLTEQWKLLQSKETVGRSSMGIVKANEAFALNKNEWSAVNMPNHGDTHFFQVKEKKVGNGSVIKDVKEGRKILANDARRFFMREVLEIISEKKAISLKWKEKIKNDSNRDETG